MTKSDKVKLLLLSLDSHLPDPRPPRVYAGAEPGPAASYYVPCRHCWNGRTIGGRPCHICRGLDVNHESESFRQAIRNHGCSRCLACGDTPGQVRVSRRERNFDTYSGKTMDELASMPPVETPRKAPGATLRAQNPSERDFAWVEERKRLEAYGDYAELRRQLEWLRDRHIGRYEVLMHYVSEHGNKWWSWSKEALASVNSTIDMLAKRMPDPVKYPGWLRKELAA